VQSLSRSGSATATARAKAAGTSRKNAEVDCAAGRYQSGIRAMEELLRRNGYTVHRREATD